MTLSRNTEVKAEKQLISEIEAVKKSLDAVTSRFEYESDPDLVEACIYEMQALSAKFRYLTREARRLGIRNNALYNYKKAE